MRFLHSMLLWSCAAAAACGCGSGKLETVSGGTSAELSAEFDLNEAVLVDVRSPDEYASGHLRGAWNIPHDRISGKIAAVAPDKEKQVILYCRSGRRADTALNALKAMGYTNVVNLGGLEDAQMRLGRPVETN